MQLLAGLAGVLALAVGRAHSAPANIDTGGFLQDGKTTYCEGVTNAKQPLVFADLSSSSAGKCPIQLTISSSLRKNAATGAAEVWVNWTASVAPVDVATSLFPRVLDAETGAPKNIIASLLRACKYGSNCATDADVVVPSAIPGDGFRPLVGPFDQKGSKSLRPFVFGFGTGAVDHVIVAKVVLPGDAKLNISATEFVTFQRVHLGMSETGDAAITTQGSSAGSPTSSLGSSSPAPLGPGTVGPSNASGTFINDVRVIAPPSKKPVISPRSVEASGTDSGTLVAANTSKKGGATNIIIISAVVGLGFVVALAYFLAVRKDKKKQQKDVKNLAHDDNDVGSHHVSVPDTTIYRLSEVADSSRRNQQHVSVSSAVGGGARPPRRQQQQPPWKGNANSVGSQGRPAPHIPGSDRGSSSSAVVDSRRSDASLMSELSSFSSLHDSSNTLMTGMTNFSDLNDDGMDTIHTGMTTFSDLDDNADLMTGMSAISELDDSADLFTGMSAISEFDDGADLMTGMSAISDFDDGSDLTMTGRSDINSLHDSRVPLPQRDLHNSLHDSRVPLPPFRDRPRRGSSAASYVDDMDDDEYSDGGTSSRLFTDRHITEVLQHANAQPDDDTNRSRYSWLNSEADHDEDMDELGELTTAIHEQYPPRRP